MWHNETLELHEKTARKMHDVLRLTYQSIGRGELETDFQIQQFIVNEFARRNLVSDQDPPWITFGQDTGDVYHCPSPENERKLESETLILIDMWCKEKIKNAPFADITWMLYFGENLPEKYEQTFQILTEARRNAIKFIHQSLRNKQIPKANEVHAKIEEIFAGNNVNQYTGHSTGHPLGFYSCHGNRKWICKSNRHPLEINLPYSMEPGLYFKDYGMRSEINFYINENYELVITTPVQEKLIQLMP